MIFLIFKIFMRNLNGLCGYYHDPNVGVNLPWSGYPVTKKRGSIKHPTHGLTSADPGVHVPFPDLASQTQTFRSLCQSNCQMMTRERTNT
jgi:hypothetical protein